MSKTRPTQGALTRTLALAFMALALLAPGESSAAGPTLFSTFCEHGEGPGQCLSIHGVAADQSNGDVYVLDGNDRISQFSPWGIFIRAWGGGVTSGGVEGTGDLTAGSKRVSSVLTTEKTFVKGQVVAGTGIPAGTTVTDVGVGTLELSRLATVSASGVALSVPEGATNVPTNERQTITVGDAPSGGSFTLTHTAAHVEGQALDNQMLDTTGTIGTLHVGDPAQGGYFDGKTITAIDAAAGTVTFSGNAATNAFGGMSALETTTPIPYNATAAQVQTALEALTDIGPGGVAVTGPAGGPYEVEFKGAHLADTEVVQLSASAGGLTPSGSVSVTTATQGAAAAEICTGDECMPGARGDEAGQFITTGGLAVDSSGNVYVTDSSDNTAIDNRRIQKFDSEGHFLLMIGGGVDQGPHHPGALCTATYIEEGDVCGMGSQGTGNGQFGAWPIGGQIAVGPDDTLYVGDNERIQEFNPDGTFKGVFPDPDEVLAGEEVQSLAVDPSSGNLYVALLEKLVNGAKSTENVHRLSPAGKSLATLLVEEPRALAVDNDGSLYVFDGEDEIPHDSGSGSAVPSTLRKFTSEGKEVPDFAFDEGISVSTAIATSSACGIPGTDVYVGNGPNFSDSPNVVAVRTYGPPPDPTVCPPPSVAPAISDQYAVSAGSDSATLKAEINPSFWPDATYYVEYGTGKCSEGGCDRQQPSAPGSKLTTATTNQAITTAGVFLHELEPGTTYHYRFVAQSSGGGPVHGVGGQAGKDGAEGTFITFSQTPQPNTNCPNQTFRTLASAKLPDCRAHEMVSPVDKNNGDIETPDTGLDRPIGGRITRSRIDQAAPGGDRITYAARRAFAGSLAGTWSNQYLASRDPESGWSTSAITPPRNPSTLAFEFFSETPFRGFSEDLCSAWIFDDSDYELTPDRPAGVPNLYRRDLCGNSGYEVLTSVAPPGYSFEDEPHTSAYYVVPQAMIDQGASTIFHAPAKLTERACGERGRHQLYETTAGGPLRLVSALPNGNGTCNGASVGTGVGSPANYHSDNVAHAVSADGSRVFWTESEGEVVASKSYGGPGKIYLRANPKQAQSAIAAGRCTQPARACTYPVSEGDSVFLTANPSGSLAIYKTGAKLYEANIEEESGELVVRPTLIAEGVQGIMGASEDARRIFLVSTKVLAEGARVGDLNLFLYENGGGFRFVTGLADIDGTGESGATADRGQILSPFNSRPIARSARVTPNGQHVVFMSRGSLTGYENYDVVSDEPNAEIYVYDATANDGAGRLSCASCNPSGARPHGRRTGIFQNGTKFFWTAAAIPGWETQFQPSRVFSEDGSRLFFESFEALVLSDTNGKRDIYEWEAAGSGDCTEASGSFSQGASGCVSLITSGESPEDSEWLDASADGRDVFFTTSESLLPQDPGLIDIYDARAGGGFPPPPSPVPVCEGEACQGAPTPPNDPTPGSSSFEGAGNVSEASAKGGKAKKKKQAKKKHKAKKRANHKRRTTR
jgi:hypothetical protein